MERDEASCSVVCKSLKRTAPENLNVFSLALTWGSVGERYEGTKSFRHLKAKTHLWAFLCVSNVSN